MKITMKLIYKLFAINDVSISRYQDKIIISDNEKHSYIKATFGQPYNFLYKYLNEKKKEPAAITKTNKKSKNKSKKTQRRASKRKKNNKR